MSRLMEFKDSSPKSGLSHLYIVRDPNDKEIIEEDDDRNHKHRRREAHPHFLEVDSSHLHLTRTYSKRNQTFGNGYTYREGGFNSNETWKSYDNSTQEDAFAGCFDKRRLYVPSFSRGVMDANQRNRVNQSMSSDPGFSNLRGRDSINWGQPDPRFSQLEITAQLVHQGSFPSTLFSRRGLLIVPNVPSTSRNELGLIPGIPSGGLDTLQSGDLQGSRRPPFLPSQGIGFHRQQCRDFEERGFCLRGDMCPMEHSVNRIVIDDVQSLSQFNLGTSAAQELLPANASTSSFMNSKDLEIINSKHRMMNDKGMYVDISSVDDLYDPDQPLWTDICPETSPGIVSVNGPHFNENDPLATHDPSDQRIVAIPRTNARSNVVSRSSSLWGRIGGSKSSKLEVSNTDSTFKCSSNLENEVKTEMDSIELRKNVVNQVGETDMDNDGPHSGLPCSFKRQYQKALRTLFVTGIPPEENSLEALLLHFKLFGKVIDIHIPSNSERAFVQFLTREEAEAAFNAPDAVMGNRFIKVRWANRDNIPDDGNFGHSRSSDTTRGVTVALGPPCLPNSAKGHGHVRIRAEKGSVSNVTSLITSKNVTKPSISSPNSLITSNNVTKPSISSPNSLITSKNVTKPSINSPNSLITSKNVTKPTISNPKFPSSSKKKLENLELMKKELRMKQEMLEQKRNEFGRLLDKLKEQATGHKDEGGSNPTSKRHKTGGSLVDAPKIEVSKPAPDSDCLSSSQPLKDNNGSSRFEGNVVVQCNKTISDSGSLESRTFKPLIRPLASLAPTFVDKYKLDNCPAVFTVLPPLPTGLATVTALKEHFSSYGELSVVETDTFKQDKSGSETQKMCALIAYTSRQSAEKAFLNGKCWQGQELMFVWGNTGKISKETEENENSTLLVEENILDDDDVKSGGKVSTTSVTISDNMTILNKALCSLD